MRYYIFYKKISRYLCCIILCAFAVSCSKNALTEPNVNPLIEIFIAHAGGAIDGYTYTNSLEALNSSYAAGCRLFEKDGFLLYKGAAPQHRKASERFCRDERPRKYAIEPYTQIISEVQERIPQPDRKRADRA